MSCFGPQAFCQTPMISTGTGSGLLPANTVQATPFIPGFSALSGNSATFPAFGGVLMFGTSPSGTANREADKSNEPISAHLSMKIPSLPLTTWDAHIIPQANQALHLALPLPVLSRYHLHVLRHPRQLGEACIDSLFLPHYSEY